jgi:hypothetical protein
MLQYVNMVKQAQVEGEGQKPYVKCVRGAGCGERSWKPRKSRPPWERKSGVLKSYISYPLPAISKIKGFYG